MSWSHPSHQGPRKRRGARRVSTSVREFPGEGWLTRPVARPLGRAYVSGPPIPDGSGRPLFIGEDSCMSPTGPRTAWRARRIAPASPPSSLTSASGGAPCVSRASHSGRVEVEDARSRALVRLVSAHAVGAGARVEADLRRRGPDRPGRVDRIGRSHPGPGVSESFGEPSRRGIGRDFARTSAGRVGVVA
jgi:hypothetical protein